MEVAVLDIESYQLFLIEKLLKLANCKTSPQPYLTIGSEIRTVAALNHRALN
jgi:hypothetical protein